MLPDILYLEETDSTNEYLKNLLCRETVEEGTIVASSFQTEGKGQKDNRWESEKDKNILFSMILYPLELPANEQFIISQIVSLTIKDFLDKSIDNISIKWPNDIYWKEKKIGGILIENIISENTITQSVIGIGLNINQVNFSEDIPNPVSLKKITGQDFDIHSMLETLGRDMLVNFSRIDSDGIAIREKYKKSLFRHQGFHLYYDGICDFLAQVKDIEPTGILVLETIDGVERKFAFKEIRFIL